MSIITRGKEFFKKLSLQDSITLKDTHKMQGYMDTEVIICVEGSDIPIFKKRNKIVIGAAGLTAKAHFNLNFAEVTPVYDTVLEGFVTISAPTTTGTNKVYLFSVGTDGCGIENSQVKPVVYSSWCQPNDLVPFRMSSSDLEPALKNIYSGYCRPTSGVNNGKHIYYFKTFDAEPVFLQRFIDGTTITPTNVYTYTGADAISYVELKMKILAADCRSIFVDTPELARVNTLSLLTATPVTLDGITYHKDIRPISKINFPNEQLIDPDKGLDITYRIYY